MSVLGPVVRTAGKTPPLARIGKPGPIKAVQSRPGIPAAPSSFSPKAPSPGMPTGKKLVPSPAMRPGLNGNPPKPPSAPKLWVGGKSDNSLTRLAQDYRNTAGEMREIATNSKKRGEAMRTTTEHLPLTIGGAFAGGAAGEAAARGLSRKAPKRLKPIAAVIGAGAGSVAGSVPGMVAARSSTRRALADERATREGER